MLISSIIPFFAPIDTTPTFATTKLNTATTWLALSFIARGKTLNNIHVNTSEYLGTLATSEITCSLEASTVTSSAAYPSGTPIETRPVAILPSPGTAFSYWIDFTGFSTALTEGDMYWLVFKNSNADPANNNITISCLGAGDYLYGSSGGFGLSRRNTTDGSTWGSSNPAYGVRIGYSDGSFDGIPIRGTWVSTEDVGIYGAREHGNKFTVPSSITTKLRVSGVSMVFANSTGTPTGNIRFRLYEGTTLVRSTPDLTPNDPPGAAHVHGFFDTPYELVPGQTYRVVAGESSNSDASTVRYNLRYVIADLDADSRGLLTFGGVDRTYYNGSSWSEPSDPDTNFVPMALFLAAGNEFALALRAYPLATLSAGNWTAVNASTLHEAVDEAITSDSDYIKSEGTAQDVANLNFGDVTTPNGGVNIVIRHRSGI